MEARTRYWSRPSLRRPDLARVLARKFMIGSFRRDRARSTAGAVASRGKQDVWRRRSRPDREGVDAALVASPRRVYRLSNQALAYRRLFIGVRDSSTSSPRPSPGPGRWVEE